MRVCVSMVRAAYEMEDDCSKVTGAAKPLADLFFQTTRGLNVTCSKERKFGNLVDRVSGTYDGCLGSMQRNQSDTVIFGLNAFPTSGANLVNGAVVTAERLGILTAYRLVNPETDCARTDALDMFGSFSFTVWLLVLVLCVVTLLLMTLTARLLFPRQNRRFRRSLRRATQVLLACCLKQHSSVPPRFMRTTSMSAIHVVSNVAFLLLTFFLTSMIKTEMVVYKRPNTVTSVEELLASDRRPSLFMPDSDEFKFAPDGSLFRRTWNRAVEMGINDSLIDSSEESVATHAWHVAKLEEGILLHDTKAASIMRIACAFSRTRGIRMQTNALFRRQDGARDRMLSLITGSQSPELVVRHLNRRAQQAAEGHLMEAAISQVDVDAVFDVSNPQSAFRKIEKCMADAIEIVDTHLQAVSLAHYHSLMMIVGAGFALAMLAHCWSHYRSPGQRKGNRTATR